MRKILPVFIICGAAIGLSGQVFAADSIDMAEAQKRGVPVQQIELERATSKIADLEKQLLAARTDLAKANKDLATEKQKNADFLSQLPAKPQAGGATGSAAAVPQAGPAAQAPILPASARPTTGKWKDWEEAQSKADPFKLPYELNGDRLGMPLELFKEKYHRVNKNDETLPFTSEKNPDSENPSMLYKAGLGKVGIVNAVVALPNEASQEPGVMPTLAGARTDVYVYQFVDGELYQITIFFRHDSFGRVLNFLNDKYGKPVDVQNRSYQNGRGETKEGKTITWESSNSQMEINEIAGSGDLSSLYVYKKDLTEKANARMSGAGK